MQRLHELGLRHPGGRPLGRGKVRLMAEDAIRVADELLVIIDHEAAVDGEHLPALAQAGEAGELLLEGMRDGLTVGRTICRRWLDDVATLPPGVPLDIKQARLASDTAGWLCRLGAKVAESAFRARQDDVVGRLLEQLNRQSTQQPK